MPEPAYRFAEALGQLLACPTARAFESRWEASRVERVAWDALGRAWERDERAWESVLSEADGLLLRLLDRVPAIVSGGGAVAARVRTFRLAQLERMQHATAAALVAQRYGSAGLHTVLEDEAAPLARRYFAFLALAERHERREWGLFARYLTPRAHHAFVGTAAEAARFYPERGAAGLLMNLFDAVRGDLHLRAFLSPRILGSLYVLRDSAAVPFLRGLLTGGHTHGDPERCEVMRALVTVRVLTGRLEPSVKYADPSAAQVRRAADQAEEIYRKRRAV
ncbi:MAG: hypothetical protein ACE5PT_10460, partial [Gemmatimonadales bacterium]